MTWQIEIEHRGLNKYRVIKGEDKSVVEQKAAAQEAAWEEQWQRKLAVEARREEIAAARLAKEEKKQLALERTEEAERAIQSLEETLEDGLMTEEEVFTWDSLINNSDFPEAKPDEPKLHPLPREPLQADDMYQPQLTLWDRISSKSRDRKIEKAKAQFEADHHSWERKKHKIEAENEKAKKTYTKDVEAWEEKRLGFLGEQKEYNLGVTRRKEAHLEKDPGAICDYCELVLGHSRYSLDFDKEIDAEYQAESGILIVDYSLPRKGDLPTTKAVKYVASRDEFTESQLSPAAMNKLYDSLLYQVALRSIHELYEADEVSALESVVFNGWVDYIDEGTGQEQRACILSVQANREEFNGINLLNVEPKACFRQLKGVGSAKLHGLTPVAPIIQIDRSDSRFVSSYEVAEYLSAGTNLAAMDWQDFEHLIRELFEKEFTQAGGEVKITQASRDGGVDAIAFDPDPIRGGRIVIQAKRYTNVVGVAAVRDLYGTVVNEGATKGILVTTAEYGPDAYEFAKGKPLTLLNGSNLLHLLEKHGHKARIDLKEAKKILAED
jgi:restriction system protein